MYTSVLLTAFLALARVAVATPPACLLGAIGVQPNPADTKALCGTLESAVAGNITQKCAGDARAAAISVYASTCLAKEQVTISINTASSTSSGTATKTGTTMTTSTGTATGTARGSASLGAPASVTGSGSAATGASGGSATTTGAAPSSTANAAGSTTPQFAMALLIAGLAGQYLL